ncbi:uncharacterized protein LOC126664232 [Mercurialis annua]|uniref:uncharacterized protein LOC126664232 n=1 Tax=Mercurialis annua TaxID=3986 RepID=UPI0024AEB610|nr:uncharacterized protein LOC126664232 [Mercurialis annua]
MDKTWIYESDRLSAKYLQGIEYFFEFALKSSEDGLLACPCNECVNVFRFDRNIVMDHLLSKGFSRGYTRWYFHGELLPSTTFESQFKESSSNAQENVNKYIQDMALGYANMGETSHNREFEENFNLSGDQNNQPQCDVLSEEAKKFYGFLQENDEKLFEGCRKHSKLSFILDLYHKKCMGGWSNASFQGLLDELRSTFPEGENLPKSAYEVKKLISKLGLGYKKIDVCPNNCMLFWKEDVDKQRCSFCNASRWHDDEDEISHKKRKTKRKSKKVLRYQIGFLILVFKDTSSYDGIRA